MGGARIFRLALRDSLPVLMGYTTMGFVAGVLLAAKGNVVLAPLWGFLSSALWVTLAVNFRYAFYGFSMLGRWKDVPFLHKCYLILMLTDENYALEVASPIKDPRAHLAYCTYLSALNHSYWIAGVVSGAVTVALLGMMVDPDAIRSWTNGMEFAMLALFLVIFTDQIRGFIRHGK